MPNSDERTRFSRFIEIAFYAALSLIYVWLMGGFKVQALFDAVDDDAQQILYDEAPAVFLILPEEVEASSDRVTNWEPASDSRINLHDVCLK